MAPKKLKYFDIRRRQKHDTNGVRVEIPMEQSINLMCFLLQGISYGKLYQDPIIPIGGKHVFDLLIENAESLPEDLWVDADGDSYPDLIAEFTTKNKKGAFDRVKALIDEYNKTHSDPTSNIILGQLFWRLPTAEPIVDLRTVKAHIVEALYSITDKKPGMRHFCAPFVSIQRGQADVVDEPDFARFMKTFQDKNIEYFYTTSGTPNEKKIAKKSREVGILKDSNANQAFKYGKGITAVGHGNKKHCSGGHCVSCNDPDHWCEEVFANGQWGCSLGSDNA